jgi:hypothetical protein
MDSLQELLGSRSPKEPPEVLAIKQYIQTTFSAPSSVGLQGETIVITVASASLANTLRYHAARLKDAAQTDKKIVFRIG